MYVCVYIYMKRERLFHPAHREAAGATGHATEVVINRRSRAKSQW